MCFKLKYFFLFLLAFLCPVDLAIAQTNSLYLEDFTSNQTLLYDFGAFALATDPTATSFSSSGVSTNIPASSDSFGGLGVLKSSTRVEAR